MHALRGSRLIQGVEELEMAVEIRTALENIQEGGEGVRVYAQVLVLLLSSHLFRILSC